MKVKLHFFLYLRLAGVSSEQTTIQWNGEYGADTGALEFQGLMNPFISGITIKVTNGKALGAGVIARTSETMGGGSSHTYYDVVVDGTGGMLDYGFRVAPGETNSGGYYDENGEWHLYQECQAIGYQQSGFTVEHSQAKTMLYLNSSFDGSGFGQVGVSTEGWQAIAPNGSFNWIGGTGGNNLYADFWPVGATDFNSISHGVFSNSPRFVDDKCGNSSGTFVVNLFNNHWSSEEVEIGWWDLPSTVNTCVNPSYHTPPRPEEACIVKMGKAGPVLFHNNLIETNEAEAKICMKPWPLGGNLIVAAVNNDTTAIGSSESNWLLDNLDFDQSIGVMQSLEVLNSSRDSDGNVVEQ